MKSPLVEDSACPVCGLAVPPDALTCPNDGTDLVAQAEKTQRRDPIIGLTLGEYRVEERIGVGGMGIVYRAVQPLIGKAVAIKVLRPELAADPGIVARLLDEARAVNAIGHRGIIDVFGFGKLPLEGRQYMVMEYLHGQPLDAVLHQRGALPPLEAVQLLEEILAAIGAAHGAGVLHRDLKPSNVFIVQQAGARFVKVLDFGLAKRREPSGGMTPSTRSDVIVGTPEYMAPEQARAQAVGPPTDLYSIGVMAFELLTGELPFRAGNAFDVARMQVEAAPPRVQSLDSSIPEQLDALVARLLEKDPAARPQTAAEVLSGLKAVRTAISGAATAIAVAPQRRPATVQPRPAPRWLAPAIGALLMAAVVLLGFKVMPRAPEPVSPSAPPAVAALPPALPVPPEPEAVAVREEPPVPAPSPVAVAAAPPPKTEPRRVAVAPKLKPPPAAVAKPGRLKLKVHGGWANFTVDGVDRGHAYVLELELPAGKHDVVASNPSKGTWHGQVTVPVGNLYEAAIELK